jgi:hypothetical protein
MEFCVIARSVQAVGFRTSHARFFPVKEVVEESREKAKARTAVIARVVITEVAAILSNRLLLTAFPL